MKVLVVEDEVLIQKSLVKLLNRRGIEALGVSQAKEAIGLIETNTYDRVLCDLMLQDLSGFDIIESAKKRYSTLEISRLFIVMTAYSSPQILEKARQYNCIVLQKPFKAVDNVIDTIIRGEHIE